VVPLTSGDRTLRAAIDEAFRDWVSNPDDTFYCLGSALGPHPYPYLVRELQSVIGREARAQILERTGALPDILVACVGGGSMHRYLPRLPRRSFEVIGVEAGGRGAGWATTPRRWQPARRRAARHLRFCCRIRRPDQRRTLGVRGPGLSVSGRARAAA
jgi:tryptophan synthase beta subunit